MSDSAQLLLRCREGDILAVESLLQNYQRSLFRLAYSFVFDTADARRAVQEALLTAIYTPGRLRADEPLETFLQQLTVKTCHDMLARQGIAWPGTGKPGEKQETISQPRAEVQPTGAVPTTSRINDSAIWKAVQDLNTEQRIPLILRYFHNYPVEQIARLLKTGKSTVITRLGLGRDRLMRSLKPDDVSLTEHGAVSATMISHDQARLLLQSAADQPLPSNEWVPLQSHLDSCEACRSYRRQLQGLERDLQRSMRLHIDAPVDFPPIDPDVLLARQRAGLRARNLLFSIGKVAGTIVTLGIGLFLAYAMFLPVTNTPTGELAYPIENLPSATPDQSTATPPVDEPYRTPVVFESTRDGNAEIYLIDADGSATNLTHNQAADTSPAWSPDGEWIAYLSDRSGKDEVYLQHVSGTQAVQVTAEADVQWQGPISWAQNGQRLAVSGTWGADANRSWIYVVQIGGDATGSEALPEVIRLSATRNGRNPRWAPLGSWLAYETVENEMVQVWARRAESNEVISLTDPREFRPSAQDYYFSGTNSFDWAPNSEGLINLVFGPYDRPGNASGGKPVERSDTSDSLNMLSFAFPAGFTGNVTQVWQTPINDARQIIGASWSPDNQIAILRRTGSQCSEGQYGLSLTPRPPRTNIFSVQPDPVEPVDVPGVCVVGTLTDSAWTPDGRWLIFQGVTAEQQAPSFYALDVIKTRTLRQSNPTSQLPMWRLSNTSEKDQLPQVRPQGAVLGINPTTVDIASKAAPLPPVSLANAPGEVVLSMTNAGETDVYTVQADGKNRRRLTRNRYNDHLLAAMSSDPGLIAFFSGQERSEGPLSIYVMERNGANPTQISNTEANPPPAQPLYYPGNFTFSPDGTKLAGLMYTQRGLYLAVLPTDADRLDETVYINIQDGRYTTPIWSDDGEKIMMAADSGGQDNLGLVTIQPKLAGNGNPEGIDAVRLENWRDGWNNIYEMVYLAESNQYAFLVTQAASNRDMQEVGIMTTGARGQNEALAFRIGGNFNIVSQNIQRIPGTDQVIVQLTLPADQKHKTLLFRFHATTGQLEQILLSEDQVYAVAVSPDGQWMAFRSDTGLWALNIAEAIAGTSGPARLADEAAGQIFWK